MSRAGFKLSAGSARPRDGWLAEGTARGLASVSQRPSRGEVSFAEPPCRAPPNPAPLARFGVWKVALNIDHAYTHVLNRHLLQV